MLQASSTSAGPPILYRRIRPISGELPKGTYKGRSYWIPGSWHVRMVYTDGVPFHDPSQGSDRAGQHQESHRRVAYSNSADNSLSANTRYNALISLPSEGAWPWCRIFFYQLALIAAALGANSSALRARAISR